MSKTDAADGEELPIAETEEIVLPTSNGSGFADGLVTTHLIGGETTLALTVRDDDVDLTVGHEADGLQLEANATLSTEDLRTLREEIDAVLESRSDGGSE